MTSGKRIQREKETVEAMVHIYCKEKHSKSTLCKDCRKLLDYSHKRLDRCKFQDHGASEMHRSSEHKSSKKEKPTCAKCTIHCYKEPQKTKMKEVMKFAGPKMITKHPVMAIRHMLDGGEKKETLPVDDKWDTKSLIYLAVVGLTLLTFFISWSTLLLNVGILFFLLIFINDKKYRNLEWSQLTKYDRIIGIIIAVVPFALFAIGFAVKTPITDAQFGSFNFLLLVLGFTLAFWGIKTSFKFALPFFAGFAMVAIWYLVSTTLFIDYIGPPFIKSSTVITGEVLELIGYEVKRAGATILLPDGVSVEILVWCSGINGVVLFSFLMILMIWNLLLKPWQKAMVVIGGAIVQYCVNIVRLVILLVLAIEFDLDVMETFHSGLGDLLFVLFFGLVYVGVLWWSGRGRSEHTG